MNKNATKRSLLASVLSLVLCVAMLVGTTFAWFTDTVSTSVNQIVAGSLDVEMEYLSKDDSGNDEWLDAQDADALFDKNALWEPGFTQVVYLKIRNVGNLALRYALNVTPVNEFPGVNVYGETLKLSDSLKFGWSPMELTGEGGVTKYDTREAARAAVAEHTAPLGNALKYNGAAVLEAGAEAAVALVVWLPESVGNEANHAVGSEAPRIELGIQLKATQAASEYDSLDNQYDADAIESLNDENFPYFDYEVDTEEIVMINGLLVKLGRNAAGAIVALEILDASAAGGKIPDSTFTTQMLNEEWKLVTDLDSPYTYLKKVTFAENAGVTAIGAHAFDRCTHLSDITIPEEVTSIGEWAFCRIAVPKITIPSGVTEIGEDAFLYCPVKSLTVNCPVIGKKMFEKCALLENIQLNGVTKIESMAFNACTGLKSIEIPETVTEIGSQAFLGCTGLKNVTILGGTIGENAFKNCKGLETVEMKNATLQKGVFTACANLSNVVVTGGNVGQGAFQTCRTLKTVTLKDVEAIGTDAFVNCTGLQEVTITGGTIGITAFKNCTSLETVQMTGVTAIGYGAFMNCKGLTEITIPASVTSVEADAFINCSGLKKVNFQANMSAMNASIFKNCSALEELTVSDATTEICANALNRVGSLTSLTVKSGTWQKANNASVTANTSDADAFLTFYKQNYGTGIKWVG